MTGLAMSQGLHKRSLTIAGHRTSVALEAEFWDELERRELVSVVPEELEGL